MTSAPPVVFHQPKHLDAEDHYPHAHHGINRLPVIPDLRFEASYIRSIRRYIDIERVESDPTEQQIDADAELEDPALLAKYELLAESLRAQGDFLPDSNDIRESEEVRLVPSSRKEIIRVQWKSVIWVTVRDQVISPLLQGALWALASYYLTPFSSQLGSRMGTFVHNRIPSKEGLGVTWLRNWAKNIGFSSDSGNTNNGHSQRTPSPSNYRY